MLDLILGDLPFVTGDEVCVLIDGLGATTRLEQFIAMRRVVQRLTDAGIALHDRQAGSYATCQEMAGFSITLMRVDDELKRYYDWPVWSPVFSNRR
jgi:dihydroxyacetone kinase-like protein